MTPFRLGKPALLFSLALSFLAFGIGFGISYRQDMLRVAETGQLAWLHLLYAQQSNDDMGIIDWSNNLEKLDSVLAFQATVNSKVTAEGGNRDFIPFKKTEGVSYELPAVWIFHLTSHKVSQNPAEFTLIYRTWPGPLLWGILAFFICLTAGMAGGFFTPKDISPVLPAAFSEPRSYSGEVRPHNPSTPNSGKPFLFLDKNYVIQQISPEAAKLLQGTSADLLNGHLIDLSPGPSLIRAIEKGEETKLVMPFRSSPRVSASLKPDPNGTFLFLEGTE